MILENSPADVQRNQADSGGLGTGGRSGHNRCGCQGLQRMSSREFQAASSHNNTLSVDTDITLTKNARCHMPTILELIQKAGSEFSKRG
jgi:hypothetical protein